jgi:integral membrane sensor domain MASE1
MASVLGLVFGARLGGEDELQSWIGWLIGGAFGALLVGLAGVIVCICGAGLIAWGAIGDIEGPLELSALEKELMLPIGRYGTGGRGAAIALIGFYLIVSAIHGDPRQAHELGGILQEMRSLALGAAITGAFALAFIGSAILDFVVASFRRFNLRNP